MRLRAIAVWARYQIAEGGASYVRSLAVVFDPLSSFIIPTDLGHVKMKRDIRPTYEVTHVNDT